MEEIFQSLTERALEDWIPEKQTQLIFKLLNKAHNTEDQGVAKSLLERAKQLLDNWEPNNEPKKVLPSFNCKFVVAFKKTFVAICRLLFDISRKFRSISKARNKINENENFLFFQYFWV